MIRAQRHKPTRKIPGLEALEARQLMHAGAVTPLHLQHLALAVTVSHSRAGTTHATPKETLTHKSMIQQEIAVVQGELKHLWANLAADRVNATAFRHRRAELRAELAALRHAKPAMYSPSLPPLARRKLPHSIPALLFRTRPRGPAAEFQRHPQPPAPAATWCRPWT